MTLQERFAVLNATTSATAKEWAGQNKPAKSRHFIFPPLSTFFSTYLGKGEWRHGMAGLTIALFDSYAVFVTYAKLWEIQNGLTDKAPELQGDSSTPSSHSHSDAVSG